VIPDKQSHWRHGVGIYSMEFPDAFVNLNSKNKDKGWSVDLDQGLGIFSEYFFQSNQQGIYVGGQIAYQDYIIENDSSGALQKKFTTLLAMPYLGYRWSFDNNIYAQAWFGVGYTEKAKGETLLGSNSYDIDPLVTFGALHLGYRF